MLNTRVPIKTGDAFPHGAYVFATTEVKPARDFEKSSREQFVQQIDRESELPVWTIDVLDADPEAQGKNAAITVRIVSQYKPMLPESVIGPLREIEFEGLTATPYVDAQRCNGGGRCRARLAWSFRATGITAPKRASVTRVGSKAGKEAEAA